MLRLNELLGQGAAATLLGRMLASARVPHALVFHGPDGAGAPEAARAFAAALLCEETVGARPCGACPACRLVEHGNHPDLIVVEREPRRKGGDSDLDDDDETEGEAESSSELRTFIVVEQIRSLTELAGLAPRRGVRRVFVIDPADRMNAEAQNALLKTLEEPPGRTVLILVAARPHLLLPTVRSRSVAVAFTPMPTSALAAALAERGVPAAEATERAALAGGRPQRALALDVPELRARRTSLVGALDRLSRRDVADLHEQAGLLAGDPDEALEALELVASLLRDAARAAAGSDPRTLLHQDLAAPLGAIGTRLGAARAAALVESVDEVSRSLRFNVNRRYAAEALLAAVAGGPIS